MPCHDWTPSDARNRGVGVFGAARSARNGIPAVAAAFATSGMYAAGSSASSRSPLTMPRPPPILDGHAKPASVARHVNGPGPLVGAHPLASHVNRDLSGIEKPDKEQACLVLVHAVAGSNDPSSIGSTLDAPLESAVIDAWFEAHRRARR